MSTRVTWLGPLCLLCGIAAVAMGLGGFLIENRSEPLFERVTAAVLNTLQLFVLNVPAESLKSPPLKLAALLAPVATAGALLAAFGSHLIGLWQRTRLWLHGADDLFIGGGDTAAGIARRRHQAIGAQRPAGPPPRIAALDPALDAPIVHALEGLRGFRALRHGDALSLRALARLEPQRARNLWIATGDDFRNLEIARRAGALLAARQRGGGATPRLLVSVRDRHLVRAAHLLYPPPANAAAEMQFFSIDRLAARALLLAHPPRLAAAAPAPHVLVVGGGALAASLVLQLAQHFVVDEAPQSALRVSWIGSGVPQQADALIRAYPALAASSTDSLLGPLLPLVHLQARDADETEVAVDLWTELQSKARFDAVYVVTTRDLSTVGAAQRLCALRDRIEGLRARDMPVVAVLQQSSGSLCALETDRAAQALAGGGPVLLFDVFRHCVRLDERYPGESLDRRAKLINHLYREGGDATAPWTPERLQAAEQSWRQTSEDFRWSSRLAADHVDLKLQWLASMRPASSDDAVRAALDAEALEHALTDRAVFDRLVRLEHRRFVVERLIDGWLPLPVTQLGRGASGLDAPAQKRQLRLNWTLLPFDGLSAVDGLDGRAEIAKDERLVRAIPALLRALQAPVPH